MTSEGGALVLDTGPVRHLALRGWLWVLPVVADGRDVVIPESVEVELRTQSHAEPLLQDVLAVDWITVDRSADLLFLAAFARYEDRLVVRDFNRGECGVLALGQVRGHEVVLDDRTARALAREDGLRLTGTLGLLCRAALAGRLTPDEVEQIAEDLLASESAQPLLAQGLVSLDQVEALVAAFSTLVDLHERALLIAHSSGRMMLVIRPTAPPTSRRSWPWRSSTASARC